MEKPTAELGRVVCSKAGRDAGKYFIISGVVDEGYVLIVDGKFHKLSNPKKKNIKHLKFLKDTINVLTEKLKKGTKVFDSEVYKALKIYNQKDNKEE
ncbi:MAG TPA: KOW domain-containing RNA-binding protein [Clostridia bacterium]